MKKEIIINVTNKRAYFPAAEISKDFVEYLKSKFQATRCVVDDNEVALLDLVDDFIKIDLVEDFMKPISAYIIDKEKEGFVVIAK